MTAEQQQLLEDLCLRAMEIDPSERAQFLEQNCADDRLRAEAESLIGVSGYAQEFFKASPLFTAVGEDGLPEFVEEPETGLQIGPYQLMERLGQGGMGVVYRASQREPVRREVAVKIIRPGMDSGLVAARFRAERQALSLMDHPNIARVVDAGTTGGDRAYFVMELVLGEPITVYCDKARLTVRQRIQLMAPVCQAIQHAHQKGVIHRDIKPSNILVAEGSDGPVPKVIDFGIAKAMEDPLHDGATFTRAFDVVGTFEYMSPEQAEPGGRGVDVRSDVYALGAVLYELLAGAPPLSGLSLREGFATVLERIQKETPIAPSQRIQDSALAGTVIAENRGCGLAQLRVQLAGECDWIALKALDKDPSRRYQSADGMARDLERYLEGEPLEAGPPSAGYRLRKLTSKYKYWVAAAAAVVLILLAGSIMMAFALRQQKRANSDALALRDVVRRIIIERPAQLAEVPNRTALRSQLMGDAEGALDALGGDAGNDDGLRLELARAYLAIGLEKGPYSGAGSENDPQGAAKYVKKSVELYAALARKQPDDPVIRRGQVEALSTWLHLQYRIFDVDEGKKAARELETEIGNMPLPLQEKIQAKWYLSEGYTELASILWNAGSEADALELERKALSGIRDAVPTDWIKDSDRLDQLSHVEREIVISAWMYEGYTSATEDTARMAVQVVSRCAASNCRMRLAQAEGTLGEIEWASGKREQGVASLRRSLAVFESLSKEDPKNAVYVNAGAQVRAYLALTLAGGPNSAEAVALAQKNLHLPQSADANLVKGHERSMVNRLSYGAALLGAGRFADAARELNDTLEENRRGWNANVDLLWSGQHLLSRALESQGKYEDAANAAREAMKSAGPPPKKDFNIRTQRAISARDFASAVSHWREAGTDVRSEALKALDACEGLIEGYAVPTGALLESPPSSSEIASIRARLSK